MNSGSFASSYVETVRLLDLTCHNFRTLSVRHPRNSVTKYPLFLGNTLTPAPRNNAARYSTRVRSPSGPSALVPWNLCPYRKRPVASEMRPPTGPTDSPPPVPGKHLTWLAPSVE